uniref:Uncharacterized protein n=1 Tax=Rhodnius prolixus TaxID=13249 RepID=T1IDT5_RHOPR
MGLNFQFNHPQEILKRALAAVQCAFIIDDRTQSMPIQSVVDVEAISSSTCIISTAPAADVLTFFYVPGTA